MTTLILLMINGRTFHAEASIPATDLPTMCQYAGIVGYVVRTTPDAIGSPVPDLPPFDALMSYTNEQA
jgi:hypothetical protein